MTFFTYSLEYVLIRLVEAKERREGMGRGISVPYTNMLVPRDAFQRFLPSVTSYRDSSSRLEWRVESNGRFDPRELTIVGRFHKPWPIPTISSIG